MSFIQSLQPPTSLFSLFTTHYYLYPLPFTTLYYLLPLLPSTLYYLQPFTTLYPLLSFTTLYQYLLPLPLPSPPPLYQPWIGLYPLQSMYQSNILGLIVCLQHFPLIFQYFHEVSFGIEFDVCVLIDVVFRVDLFLVDRDGLELVLGQHAGYVLVLDLGQPFFLPLAAIGTAPQLIVLVLDGPTHPHCSDEKERNQGQVLILSHSGLPHQQHFPFLVPHEPFAFDFPKPVGGLPGGGLPALEDAHRFSPFGFRGFLFDFPQDFLHLVFGLILGCGHRDKCIFLIYN